MRRYHLALLLLLPLVVGQAQDRLVVLAGHRAGQIEVLDSDTLQLLTSIKVLPLLDGVASGPGGLIFLREGLAPDFQGCCALYALDLKTLKMKKLLQPIANLLVSPDREHVVTQRGNVGIEVFDARTLQSEPPIPRAIAPGVYGLSFSPDGRLLFGASNFPGPTIDIVDFSERKLVRRFVFPPEVTLRGAWVADDYYVYGYRKTAGQLWRMNAADPELGTPLNISLPDPIPECGPHEQEVLGAGSRLLLYEPFGSKPDRRPGCARKIPGGVFSFDPQTGKQLAHSAPDLHFAWLIPAAGGQELYGVDVRDASWSFVSLVRLNAATGDTLARRDLDPDVWFIDLAAIPAGMVSQGNLKATTE